MNYDVYAIKYAQSIRPSRDYYMGHDPHNGPHPIYYYVWLIRSNERIILIDTGFDAARAIARKRDFGRCPTQGLASLGVVPEDVDTVIVTHLHYDHAGNLDKFPNARFVLQDEEMRYATGRDMRHALIRLPFELEDVQTMLAHNYAERVDFVQGSETIAPGVDVHLVPGHSRGLQCVTVQTARGRLCLASDAAHFFGNVRYASPFPVTVDVAATLHGHDKVVKLAGTADLLIPGHDPLVAEIYPAYPEDSAIFDLGQPPSRSISLKREAT